YSATATYDIDRSCDVTKETTSGDDGSISDSSSAQASMASTGNGPSISTETQSQRFSVLNTCSGIRSSPPTPTSAAFEAYITSVTRTIPFSSGCPIDGAACAHASRSQISQSSGADHSKRPIVVS